VKPDYVLETNAGQFYSGNGYVECPRCHASFRLDALPLLVLASDAMEGLCPECRLFVVVNMMSGRVIFEGFKRSEDQDGRMLELREAGSTSAPERKSSWKFW
jgi:hypothetical protein